MEARSLRVDGKVTVPTEGSPQGAGGWVVLTEEGTQKNGYMRPITSPLRPSAQACRVRVRTCMQACMAASGPARNSACGFPEPRADLRGALRGRILRPHPPSAPFGSPPSRRGTWGERNETGSGSQWADDVWLAAPAARPQVLASRSQERREFQLARSWTTKHSSFRSGSQPRRNPPREPFGPEPDPDAADPGKPREICGSAADLQIWRRSGKVTPNLPILRQIPGSAGDLGISRQIWISAGDLGIYGNVYG